MLAAELYPVACFMENGVPQILFRKLKALAAAETTVVFRIWANRTYPGVPTSRSQSMVKIQMSISIDKE